MYCHAAAERKSGQNNDKSWLVGEEKEGEELCTVGRDESAPVTVTCSEGYMLQVMLEPSCAGRVARHTLLMPQPAVLRSW